MLNISPLWKHICYAVTVRYTVNPQLIPLVKSLTWKYQVQSILRILLQLRFWYGNQSEASWVKFLSWNEFEITVCIFRKLFVHQGCHSSSDVDRVIKNMHLICNLNAFNVSWLRFTTWKTFQLTLAIFKWKPFN